MTAVAETTCHLTYTEAMVRDAVRAYVWRRFFVEQKGLWLVVAGMVLLLVWLVCRGETGWLTGVIGTIVALPCLMVVVGWRAHFRNSVGRFRAMRSPTADLIFREDGLSFISDLGTAYLPWPRFTELWERPACWMIFTAPSGFNIIPKEGLMPDVDHLLRANIPLR